MKLRSTQLDALLRQWSMYEEMLQQYEAGNGSMAREAEKTASSWEGSLNRLSNSWTDFINGLVTSDTAKGVIDFLTTIIKNIDKLRDSIGTIPTLLGSIATVGAIKNVGEQQNTPSFVLLHLSYRGYTRFKIMNSLTAGIG